MVENDDSGQNGLPERANSDVPEKQTVYFDEEIYLRLNPDVRLAVAAGNFRSGREHYERYGRAEGRPFRVSGMQVRDRIIVSPNADNTRERPKAPACAVDAVKVSHSGAIFVVGWLNDANDRLDSLDLYFTGWSISFDALSLARLRRPDAETALGNNARHPYGFWGFLYGARRLQGGVCSVVLRLKSGAEVTHMNNAETVEDHDMRKLVLGHVAGAQYFGNPYFEAVATVEHAIGTQMVDFNKMLSRRAVNAPYIERFGAAGRRFKASFVVCLYGRPEYMFLQNAMFSRQPGVQDYEFIYVSNSPHMAEQLLKEARLCAHIYGLALTVICLSSNAGFGAANIVATQHASSDRLVIMNPDVFPKDPAWVFRHNALLEELPSVQTDLFGAPLYYDDGSLMHAGMYFCCDTVPSFARGRKTQVSILRVEHYGKGAPPETAQFIKPRPVPAVTGAFMSLDRAWFEQLGGFTQDYVFGHYEDADLCLKSIGAGRLPWLHDVRLWHLEGKGSTRLPQHEGGSTINRWLFTKTWGEVVSRDLLGPEPAHAGFNPGAEPAPEIAALPVAKPVKRRRA
jgi:GT2 family glycosyltransferase